MIVCSKQTVYPSGPCPHDWTMGTIQSNSYLLQKSPMLTLHMLQADETIPSTMAGTMQLATLLCNGQQISSFWTLASPPNCCNDNCKPPFRQQKSKLYISEIQQFSGPPSTMSSLQHLSSLMPFGTCSFPKQDGDLERNFVI